MANNVNKPSWSNYPTKPTSTVYVPPSRDHQHHYSQPILTTTAKDRQFPVISKINTNNQTTTKLTKWAAEREQREEDRVDRARAWEKERAAEREKRKEDRVERARVRKEVRAQRLEQIPTTNIAKVTKTTHTRPKNRQFPVIMKINTNSQQIPTTTRTAKVTKKTHT